MKQVSAFFFAIQFLTRIPVPVKYAIDDDTQRNAFYYHGAVGALIGLILWLSQGALSFVLSPHSLIMAGILLLIWIAITGALHLDGLGDSADAWLGGYGDKEKTLAIMKDPTSGPAAIVWIVVVLLLKFSAIASLLSTEALFFAPLIARLASMVLFITTPYVREKGLGSSFAEGMQHQVVWLQLFVVSGIGAIWVGTQILWALLLAFLVTFYLRHLMLSRINGTTGDTAGALIECVEVAVLIGFLISVNLF